MSNPVILRHAFGRFIVICAENGAILSADHYYFFVSWWLCGVIFWFQRKVTLNDY